ncbi:MAG TPA: class I SAM-dependent methyltransferase [Capillimicrobium sp.]|nr:class I SAM-dependent methyltransferase [Capillimicrobium sp.]
MAARAETADAGGFRAESFDGLADVEDASFWFRARNRLIAWAVGAHAPGARSLLEVGCGTGYVLAGLRDAFPGLRLTGLELFEEGLAHARARLGDEVELIAADARDLPYDAAFDVVGAFDVLEHIEEDEAVLAAMVRATRPGGVVLVTVPQHAWLWSADDDYACHVRRYSRAELLAKAQRAGLTVEYVTSWVASLLPAMALSRLTRRRATERYDPQGEHRRAERVGALLERVLDAELALVRRHVSLPAGGSLLLVGRRG